MHKIHGGIWIALLLACSAIQDGGKSSVPITITAGGSALADYGGDGLGHIARSERRAFVAGDWSKSQKAELSRSKSPAVARRAAIKIGLNPQRIPKNEILLTYEDSGAVDKNARDSSIVADGEHGQATLHEEISDSLQHTQRRVGTNVISRVPVLRFNFMDAMSPSDRMHMMRLLFVVAMAIGLALVACASASKLPLMQGILLHSRQAFHRDACVPKEVLMAIGIVTTSLQGGGLIFGFSAFADQLMQLPGSPYTVNNVSAIFAVGHNVVAAGCIASGALVDYCGPRVCAASGLVMEAIGHLLLAHATSLPRVMTMGAYGLVGWGGCQVLLSALTFTGAFVNGSKVNALLTAAFQAGAFVFMALPHVRWEVFFYSYCGLCIAAACLCWLLYPDAPPHAHNVVESSLGAGQRTSGSTLASLLRTPRIVWFLLTFMIAGSAFIYGAGEFPAAILIKDACTWDDAQDNFVSCRDQAVQDHMNFFLMPLVGNSIFPFSLLLGMIIDRWNFVLPAFVNVFFVQAFILALWQLGLTGQYFTLILYNIANSAVFTIQNAYICSVGNEHIGKLFAISNLALSVGNLVSDWLNFNPFGQGPTQVGKSLAVSCTFWLLATCPCYAWAAVEARHQRGVDAKAHHPTDSSPISNGDLSGSTMLHDSQPVS